MLRHAASFVTIRCETDLSRMYVLGADFDNRLRIYNPKNIIYCARFDSRTFGYNNFCDDLWFDFF